MRNENQIAHPIVFVSRRLIISLLFVIHSNICVSAGYCLFYHHSMHAIVEPHPMK